MELRPKQSVQMARGSQVCKQEDLLGGTCIPLHSLKHLPALLILRVSHLVSLLGRNRGFRGAEAEAEG